MVGIVLDPLAREQDGHRLDAEQRLVIGIDCLRFGAGAGQDELPARHQSISTETRDDHLQFGGLDRAIVQLAALAHQQRDTRGALHPDPVHAVQAGQQEDRRAARGALARRYRT